MNRIALFLPNWIGDVVMATPAIRAVFERFPTAELVAVCKPYVADVVAGAPWFGETILCDSRGRRGHRLWAVAAQLRKRRIDAALLFPNSFRSALLARLGRCRNVIGFSRYGRALPLHQRVGVIKGNWDRLNPSPTVHVFQRLSLAYLTVDA